nr:retrovirus-related Pol polyprotein from transposon TNT 1-94 [Tanacetum cinerariifolium]
MKEIKREFSVPRTPQQNGIAERKNKTPIEAARTMLADSLLPIPFWAEAVNTACYVQNRVLVTKPHNKTPYKLLHGRTPSISFMRPFGCPVTILNTLDSLGKFKGKVDEGFLVGYYFNSKAFRVFNSRTRIVQETLHVNFLENKPNIAGFQDKFDAEKAGEEINQQYVLFPVWSSGSTNPQNYDGDVAFDGKEHDIDAKKPKSEVILSPSSSAQSRKQDDKTKKEAKGKSPYYSSYCWEKYFYITNPFSDASPSNTTASPTQGKSSFIDASQLSDDLDMPELEDITYSDDENDVGTEADFNNLETSITVRPIPTTRIHKDHPISQIIGDLSSTTQTRRGTQEVDLPHGKRAIGTKWVYKNKKDERGIVVKSKARLVAQGHTHEEGIDCEEVFALVARIEAIRLFLAYASFIGFMVYQMDVKSAFLYGTIKEEVQDKYVTEILRKFGLTKGKSASTPIDIEKPLLKDPHGEDVDVHTYRLMIGSLMYLTSSKPDIMFAVNDVTRMQALVDKKKVVVTEAAIREVLRLDDAEGVDCLPDEEIFAELARMGYEKPSTNLTFYKAFFSSQWKFLIHTILLSISAKQTSWNEFSSAMASAVICLSKGRKFNFSKYIFDSLSGERILWVETPLFEGMLVRQEIEEGGDEEEHVEDVTASDAAQGDDIAAHGEVPTVQHTPPQSPQAQPQPQPQQAADFPMSLLQEALDACAALTRRVEHLKHDKLAQALEITKLKRRVKKLEKENRVRVLKLRSNETAKDLWDALKRQMRGFKYGEQDRKAAILYEYKTFKDNEGEQLLDTYLCYLQQNQSDVNDALGYKKKAVVINSNPLALVAEKTNVSKQKEKVVVSSESEGSGTDDFSELKKITDLLAKAFNRRKFYSKPTNNNLRTSSTSQFFVVDAAMDLEEKHQVFNAAGEEINAAKQKLMLLDNAAEG